ncbi:hypothetical protein [Cellulomonas xiejunii]|uniref:hypothetical protein n=1 Tax=Cellulomonas xiejunii TaxID=2968083 RepID=UPI001D0E9A6F|nr:hypothetical protein [Cellulomonas xiejunii]MCC2313545.1 hypothetical protein [Cellulomonas xiejunii]
MTRHAAQRVVRPSLAVLWAAGLAGQTWAASVLASPTHVAVHLGVLVAVTLVTAAAAAGVVLLPPGRWGEVRSSLEFAGCAALVLLAGTLALLVLVVLVLAPSQPWSVRLAVAWAAVPVPAAAATVAVRVALRTERRPVRARARWAAGSSVVGGVLVVLMTSLQ